MCTSSILRTGLSDTLESQDHIIYTNKQSVVGCLPHPFRLAKIPGIAKDMAYGQMQLAMMSDFGQNKTMKAQDGSLRHS